MEHAVHRIDFAAGRTVVARRQAYTKAATDIREALYSAERSIEDGLLNMGRLQETIIARRRAVGLASTVGHELVLQTAEATGKMIEVLNAAVRLHGEAQAQSERLGVRMDIGSHKEEDAVWGPPGG